MKKILFTIVMTLCLAAGAMAQDGFFNNWSDLDNRENNTGLPEVPNGGQTDNQSTPLGTGLLVLTALGAGYALSKRRD
ncbi:MAG: hypothetical protein KBT67_09425 [bacterium]|nr:hypothetical protein [Candidatus Limimorpha caballi]